MNKKTHFSKFSLYLRFSLHVFSIFVATVFLTGFIGVIIFHIIPDENRERIHPILFIIVPLISSIIIGLIMFIFAGSNMLKSVQDIIKAINTLASGDFSARLDVNHPPEFKKLSDSFNKMANELESTEILKCDFINSFSHEFKTPIVSIKGFAEILKYSDLTEVERNEYLDIVISETSRLSNLSTSILNLSKLENQGLLLYKSSFNIGEQLRQCILTFDKRIPEKKLELLVDIDDFDFYGNKDILNQLWTNLIDNAIKYTFENGTISISIKNKLGDAFFVISDNGCGIDEQEKTRVFNKFYQCDKSRVSEGNGIGLAIVKKAVELHNGNIECTSELNVGTTFTVVLPSEKSN